MASTTWIGSSVWCSATSPATSSRCPRSTRATTARTATTPTSPPPVIHRRATTPLHRRRTTTMTDDLAQLLRSLRLGKIAEMLDEELARANEEGLSHQELLARLLRAQWHHQQQSALSWRIKQA